MEKHGVWDPVGGWCEDRIEVGIKDIQVKELGGEILSRSRDHEKQDIWEHNGEDFQKTEAKSSEGKIRLAWDWQKLLRVETGTT